MWALARPILSTLLSFGRPLCAKCNPPQLRHLFKDQNATARMKPAEPFDLVGKARDPDPSGSRRSRFASATGRSNRRNFGNANVCESRLDQFVWRSVVDEAQCGFASGRKFGISVGRKFHDPAFAPGMSGSNRPSTRMNASSTACRNGWPKHGWFRAG